MKCENIQNNIVDFLDENLSKEDVNSIQNHLESCDECSKELEDMKKLFFDLSEDEMEQPSARLQINFEEMLDAEKKEQEAPVIQLQERTNWKSYLRIAASILIVVSAFLIGKYADISSNTQVNQILAQIESQSASQRIAAVDLSENFEGDNTKIIQALINRLLYDDKPSVRLAAVEALTKFASLEMVKEALIKSLETDKDPAIQIELIQVLVKIQEKRALIPMKNLLQNDEVPEYVKKEIQINIPSLS
tara:strand:- start:52049 stop:52792 length:744 start_codon:yes stop_codon:yes gene_type:complete